MKRWGCCSSRSTRPGCEQGSTRCFGLPFAPRAVLLQSARASPVGAPAPGANNGRLGALASPFAPRAVLLHSTRASCVGAPAPGTNNGRLGILASPFAPGAVLVQSCTRLLRRSTRPGCERGDGRSPSQLPTQSVDNSVRSLGATAAGPRHDRL